MIAKDDSEIETSHDSERHLAPLAGRGDVVAMPDISLAYQPAETMTMRRLLRSLAIAGCLAVSFAAGSAVHAEPVKIKFTLDWKLQGLHAWFYWAKARGYFTAENLDVTIDQGEGSAATVTRVMSGAYDAGFGDINAIIQNAATRPTEAPVMVYMIYNKAGQGRRSDQGIEGSGGLQARRARGRRLA
jgi:hypothetical protein